MSGIKRYLPFDESHRVAFVHIPYSSRGGVVVLCYRLIRSKLWSESNRVYKYRLYRVDRK